MFFSKALLLASLALSALASPHMARRVDHRAVAHRAAMPEVAPEPVVVHAKQKRANSSRCKVRSSSSAAAPSSSIIPPKNVESAAPSPSSSQTPATTKAAEPTSQPAQHTTPHTTEKPSTTKSSPPAKPTTQPSSGSGNDPLHILTGTHDGQGTYYGTGLGSCGITNQDTDFIAAVSHELYDNYPGYTGGNPNNNPLCGRKIKANYQGKSVTVTAVDRCTGCAMFDLDFSPSAFNQLADFAVGRLDGVTWQWA